MDGFTAFLRVMSTRRWPATEPEISTRARADAYLQGYVSLSAS
jgi:hypothetical protein